MSALQLKYFPQCVVLFRIVMTHICRIQYHEDFINLPRISNSDVCPIVIAYRNILQAAELIINLRIPYDLNNQQISFDLINLSD